MKNKPNLRGRRVEGFGQAAKTDAFSPAGSRAIPVVRFS
jgi:hypothetical protein